MGHTYRDPTDHFRTTHQRAGESMIDAYCWPGLFLIALGVLAVSGCLAAAAYRHQEMLLTTGAIGVVAIAIGASWIVVEHRRVRRMERRWLAEHPGMRSDTQATR